MARLATPDEKSLPAATLSALEPFRLNGKLAPVYLQIGNSDAALNAYLNLENALKKSTLSLREIEAIKLLVSQINRCDHCLAIHNFKATAAGLDDEQKLAVRRGSAESDQRLSAIVTTVNQFFTRPGVVDDAQLSLLRNAGLTDSELVDIALVAATIFFTNVFNHLNDTKTSFTPAPALSAQ